MTKNAGTFKKGYDPRRITNEGLTAYRKTIRELMQDRASEAVDYMFEVLHDPKASKKLRVTVAQDIQDRYYGKSVDRVAVIALDSASGQDASTMKDSELQQVINTILHKPIDKCIDIESEVIEEEKPQAKQ